jgi:LemA protein
MKTRRLLMLIAVVAVCISASGCGYNTLTTKQQDVKAKWANVETQLQRRGDLINNLVESAKLAGNSGTGSPLARSRLRVRDY